MADIKDLAYDVTGLFDGEGCISMSDDPCSEVSPEVLTLAKEKFWRQSEAWTGHRWDWDIASAEVRENFIRHALNDTRPPLPEEI